MKVPCILCGKTSELEGMCSDCWLKKQELFSIKDFEIRICECDSVLLGGVWKRFDIIEDAIETAVKKNISTKNTITDVGLSIRIVGNKAQVSIACTGLIKPCKKTKTETKETVVTIRTAKCEECKKHLASYYEAVIQLRVRGKEGEDMLERITKEAGETAININTVQGGWDIIMFKDNAAKHITTRLRKIGYSITKSNVFVVLKNNKKIYRNYYSVKKGD